MYEHGLQNLGLTEKEAKIYLAALESGPESVQNIAKRAGINRPTTYLQIESLKAKGLMGEFQKGKKTFFVAESPNRLLSLLGSLEKNLEIKKLEAHRIVPLLNEVFAGAGERPKVRFFEGSEGAKAMLEDFLSVQTKRIESFTNLDKLFELFPKHEDDYTKRRIAKGIETLVIYSRKAGPIKNATDSGKLRQAKFAPTDKLPMTADITVFDNKVALITYKAKPVGVFIEDKDMADAIRAIFYMIWNSL